MGRPSPNCFTNRVNWYAQRPDQDQDGSLVASNVPTLANIPCSVQLKEGVREVHENDRVTTYFYGWIEFLIDYGMKIDDKIVWVGNVRTHTLFIDGVTDGAGKGVIFGAQVSERS